MLTSAPAANTPFTCLATALFDKLASSARAASLFCPGLGTVCPRPEPPQLPRFAGAHPSRHFVARRGERR